jgi:hypothetical protein
MPGEVRVRVADGDVWVDGEHYVRGDEVDIPERVYEQIPHSFERVESDDGDGDEANAESGADGDEPPAVDDLDPHPAALTVDELRERVQDVDDIALLEAIRTAEQATDGEARTTAIEAIENRLAALTDDDGEA